MGNLGMTFDDSNAVEPGSYGALPAGTYTVLVERSELRDTQRGDGKYINLMLRVVEPMHKNAVLWGRVTVANPNETATRIGHAEITAIRRACGIQILRDTSDLLNHVLDVRVKIEEYGGKEQNRITAYLPRGAALEAEPPQRPPKTNPARPAGSKPAGARPAGPRPAPRPAPKAEPDTEEFQPYLADDDDDVAPF